MAVHRALQALRAAKAILIAANTRAGANVEIGRTAPIDEQDAIDLHIGSDSPVNDFGTDNLYTIDSVQRIYVDFYTRSAAHEEQIVENLFELRAQTHAALVADWTLGLGFVIAIRYQGAEDIQIEASGDRLGFMRTIWDIAYRMDYDNPAS